MDWIPGDWRESPVFLEHIKDPDYRQWASDLNAFWKQLGRQMTEDVAVSTSQLLICLFFFFQNSMLEFNKIHVSIICSE